MGPARGDGEADLKLIGRQYVLAPADRLQDPDLPLEVEPKAGLKDLAASFALAILGSGATGVPNRGNLTCRRSCRLKKTTQSDRVVANRLESFAVLVRRRN